MIFFTLVFTLLPSKESGEEVYSFQYWLLGLHVFNLFAYSNDVMFGFMILSRMVITIMSITWGGYLVGSYSTYKLENPDAKTDPHYISQQFVFFNLVYEISLLPILFFNLMMSFLKED